jgi:hypothetical protein
MAGDGSIMERQPSRDMIDRVLQSLVAERQRLRQSRCDRPVLEANRLAIVYWQHELHAYFCREHATRLGV